MSINKDYEVLTREFYNFFNDPYFDFLLNISFEDIILENKNDIDKFDSENIEYKKYLNEFKYKDFYNKNDIYITCAQSYFITQFKINEKEVSFNGSEFHYTIKPSPEAESIIQEIEKNDCNIFFISSMVTANKTEHSFLFHKNEMNSLIVIQEKGIYTIKYSFDKMVFEDNFNSYELLIDFIINSIIYPTKLLFDC